MVDRILGRVREKGDGRDARDGGDAAATPVDAKAAMWGKVQLAR